ncbi:MAG: helix-turn-helix domain-containing protein, partial [Gammaproteobacteria bacterium]|nr:helix-turn-helix domain-containing protein [Gammaproteobacteria bacterium]
LLYGLGPSLYLYCKTVSDPTYRLSSIDLMHFLPVVLETIYYFSPFYAQPGMYTFTNARDIYHMIWMIEQSGAVLSVLIYLFLANRLLLNYRKWVNANYSDTGSRSLTWLRRPVVLYSIFFVVWLSVRAIDVTYFGDKISNQQYYPLLIFLSFSTYWIGTKGYIESQIDAAGFSQSNRRSADDPADDAMLEAIFQEVAGVMSRDKMYLDNDLNLTQLAEQTGVNPRLLSKAINERAQMNFYDFVNRYRIDEFKRLAVLPTAPKTLFELALRCGFGSKTTFNHVFKQSTGLTPGQYRRQANSAALKSAEDS